MILQTDAGFGAAPYDAIMTDGCFWRTLLHASEVHCGKALTLDELKYAYQYAIPNYMEDHQQPGKSRCYIQWKGHEEIIRIGFYILGERNVDIKYRYRYDIDTDKTIIGTEKAFYGCTFFVGKCKLRPNAYHFYESDLHGAMKWNPHTVFTNDLTSLRGFLIKVR